MRDFGIFVVGVMGKGERHLMTDVVVARNTCGTSDAVAAAVSMTLHENLVAAVVVGGGGAAEHDVAD